jgi:hypothetical protein
MSNKPDDHQILSLPKGGGSLSGIGESFQPDLYTGTGNFTVPINLLPGRNDFQPDLKLVYSSGHGNGEFGLGWNLSVPGVARKTAKGVPRYDAEDTFLLSGAEHLMLIEGQEAINTYRPRTEGLFAHIERHLDAKNDFWKVKQQGRTGQLLRHSSSTVGGSGSRGQSESKRSCLCMEADGNTRSLRQPHRL